MKPSLTLLAGATALLASTALPSIASAKDISFIYCGEAINPVHAKAFKEWNDKNPDAKVAPELVGWEQCQDKTTTLAAAGNPVGIAYVGSRTLKQFANNDLIVTVPMTDAEKASYQPHIVDTVTIGDKQWGVPIAFSTKALYWNKDLFKKAGLDPDKPPQTWDEEIADAKIIKDKTGIAGFGVVAKTFDNTMHQFLHWVYTEQRLGDRRRRQDHAGQPGQPEGPDGAEGHHVRGGGRPHRLRTERGPRDLSRRQARHDPRRHRRHQEAGRDQDQLGRRQPAARAGRQGPRHAADRSSRRPPRPRTTRNGPGRAPLPALGPRMRGDGR